METKIQDDNTVDCMDSKPKAYNLTPEIDTESEPSIKKSKLNENEDEIRLKENEELKKLDNKDCELKLNNYREPKVLGEDDTDEEVELDKNGILYFLDRLTTSKTTHEEKLIEFEEYLKMEISDEAREKLRSSKKIQANIEQKPKVEEEEKDEGSDNEENSKKEKNNSDDEDTNEHEIPPLGFDYPIEQDASDMMEEVDFNDDGSYPSVTERYFTPYYAVDVKEPCDDVCILIHSNRVCMLTLAPSHIIFQQNKTITSCSYQVSEKLDRTKNKVSGKGKRGAQPMQKNSYLCRLTCSDGSIYMIRCCMNGKLLEVNERLLEDPEMLKKPPHFGGYIAIVLPNLKYHDEQLKKHLLDQKQYEEALRRRNEKTNQDPNVLEENTNKEEKLINAETNESDKNNEQVADTTNIDKTQGKKEIDDVEMVSVNETK